MSRKARASPCDAGRALECMFVLLTQVTIPVRVLPQPVRLAHVNHIIDVQVAKSTMPDVEFAACVSDECSRLRTRGDEVEPVFESGSQGPRLVDWVKGSTTLAEHQGVNRQHLRYAEEVPSKGRDEESGEEYGADPQSTCLGSLDHLIVADGD